MIKFQYEFNTWKNWGEFHITPSVSGAIGTAMARAKYFTVSS